MHPIWLIRYSCATLLILSLSIAQAQAPAELIPPLVDSLIQQSRSYTAETAFDEAFATSAQAGQAARACCGEQSAAYAAYCFNEGRIRYFMSRNQEAIPWYIKARDLRASILGTDDVEYGKSCNNLAIVYDVMGRYEDAEPLYLEALAIREATAGRESTTYANALSNLAGMYANMAKSETALSMARAAMEIREALVGKVHTDYAESLVLLATLHYDLNNNSYALPLLQQAKAIYDQQESLDFYGYCQVLDNLGVVHQALLQSEEAKVFYQEAADLREQVLGSNSYEHALSLSHLATVEFAERNTEMATSYLQRAIQIMENTGLQNSLPFASFLRSLSNIQLVQGKVDLASQTLDRSLSILDQQVSQSHPTYLSHLHHRAKIEEAQGDLKRAALTKRQLAKAQKVPIISAVRYLSDEALSKYIASFEHYLFHLMNLTESEPELADLCYDQLLIYKGFLLDKAISFRNIATKSPANAATFQQLRGLHRQIVERQSSKSEEDDLFTLQEQARALERSILQAGTGESLEDIMGNTDWKSIQTRLASDAAAIEFATYTSFDQYGADKAVRHAAIIILPGEAKPVFVPLGTMEKLKSLISTEQAGKEQQINALYDWAMEGQDLHEELWQPIQEKLTVYPGLKRIYYSKSGVSHRINLSAIPIDERRSLGQQYQLINLVSTRDLLDQATEDPIQDQSALLLGGIDYGSVDNEQVARPPTTEEPTSVALGRRSETYPSQRGYNGSDGFWQPLPWTEVEITYAHNLLLERGFQSMLKTGMNASEEVLKSFDGSTDSPFVLHLATHGYFFQPDQTVLPSTYGGNHFASATQSMLRSGLLLADANYAWVKGKPRSAAQEDGILTAYELSLTDLGNTRLAVLSACETGLGEIQATEGVYGLQRALKIAGAEYIIMSLWQVSDYQTQAFMTSFYLAWLEEGLSIPQAFRSAQAYMRARYKNAFDWAGFVLLQ